MQINKTLNIITQTVSTKLQIQQSREKRNQYLNRKSAIKYRVCIFLIPKLDDFVIN